VLTVHVWQGGGEVEPDRMRSGVVDMTHPSNLYVHDDEDHCPIIWGRFLNTFG
jgi:hypothetical protein